MDKVEAPTLLRCKYLRLASGGRTTWSRSLADNGLPHELLRDSLFHSVLASART